jgi:hypothetical protein
MDFMRGGGGVEHMSHIGDSLIRSFIAVVISIPDPDPALFGSGFRDAKKNLAFLLKFFLLISYCRYMNISLKR